MRDDEICARNGGQCSTICDCWGCKYLRKKPVETDDQMDFPVAVRRLIQAAKAVDDINEVSRKSDMDFEAFYKSLYDLHSALKPFRGDEK